VTRKLLFFPLQRVQQINRAVTETAWYRHVHAATETHTLTHTHTQETEDQG